VTKRRVAGEKILLRQVGYELERSRMSSAVRSYSRWTSSKVIPPAKLPLPPLQVASCPGSRACREDSRVKDNAVGGSHGRK